MPSSRPMQRSKQIALFILVILLFAVLGLTYALRTNAPVVSQQSGPMEVQIPWKLVSSTRAGWNIYKDYRWGYQLEVPAAWKMGRYETHPFGGPVIMQVAFDPTRVIMARTPKFEHLPCISLM